MTVDNYQPYEVPSDDEVLLRRTLIVAVNQVNLIPNRTSKLHSASRKFTNSLATLVPTELLTSLKNIATVQSVRGN
jgi:hypothetical protein